MYTSDIKITEKLVAYIWQRQWVCNVVADKGEHIEVIFPGRVCHERGCDFQDALFSINNNKIRGNVEIHIKSSQWYSHGHHINNSYNSIALHVVFWHNCPSPIILENGETIPTVALGNFLSRQLKDIAADLKSLECYEEKCSQNSEFWGRNKNELITALHISGDRRFQIKIKKFQDALRTDHNERVLIRGVARALGYNKNTDQCEKLASVLPMQILKQKSISQCFYQAVILGVAGLLPSQRTLPERIKLNNLLVSKIESIWRSLNIKHTMHHLEWNYYQVRPDNYPVRRLVGLSYLLSRYSEKGLVESLIYLVRNNATNKGHHLVENGFILLDIPYWSCHYDFGVYVSKNQAIIGRTKAAQIVVNILLPFVAAWSKLMGDKDLYRKAIFLYETYPGLSDNQITRYMKKLFSPNTKRNISAREQQGMIHIFNHYCRDRDCSSCIIQTN